MHILISLLMGILGAIFLTFCIWIYIFFWNLSDNASDRRREREEQEKERKWKEENERDN